MAIHPIKNFLGEFKEFINRGNLLVVAIGFVMGATFTGLVTALVENVIMPIVAIPFGKPNFDGVFILRVNDADITDAAIHAPWLARPVDLAAAGVRLGETYPHPIVDHAEARALTLKRYAVVKGV